MLTKNFKTLMNLVLASNSNGAVQGMKAVTGVAGDTVYAANNVNGTLPNSTYTDFTLNANAVGISVGSGNTAATENDYNLESTITSGLTALIQRRCGMDSNGNPFQQFDIMLNNTSDSAITVREIGYKQYLRCATTLGSMNLYSGIFLIDRTVLPTAVTVPVNDYAVIRYTLKTVISAGGNE